MLDAVQYFLYNSDCPAFARDILNFHPDPVQHQLLATTASRCILNCSRQWGKSTVTAIKALHHAAFTSDRLVIVVSPSDRQSGEFIRKVSDLSEKAGFKPRGDGKNSLSLLYPNKSRIIGLPCNEETIRGFSGVTLLLIDEASRVPDSLYRTVRPMLAASQGALWLISTPAGRSGFFYRIWTSTAGLEKWTRISVPATECPRISSDFLETERIEHGDRLFRQEYLCEFHDSDDQVLSQSLIDRALSESVVSLEVAPPGPIGPVPRFQRVVVYPRSGPEPPPPEKTTQHGLYFGIDFGQVHDHSAIAVIEKTWVEVGPVDHADYERDIEERFAVRYLERMPLGTPYTSVISRLGQIVRNMSHIKYLRIAADATGVGLPLIELIRRLDLGRMLYPVKITGGSAEPHGDSRFYYLGRSHLINGLLLQFENPFFKVASDLELSTVLTAELASLRVKASKVGNDIYTTSSPDQHDDLLVAVALANWDAVRDVWRKPHGRLFW